MGAVKNREKGADFEGLFKKQAQLNGLAPIKNELSCRRVAGGRVIILKSELDFKLIRPTDGRIGFFDCKNFQDDYFTYSKLDQPQIDRAVLYNEYCIPAGFIVMFEQMHVYFYSGYDIINGGKGSRFDDSNGLYLGRYDNFDLRKVMDLFKKPRLQLRA